MVLFCLFFLLHLLLFSFTMVILNYCRVYYKVFIIRNNKLIYLSQMKSCLWGWSCYHYSLAQRPISHRKHMFHATFARFTASVFRKLPSIYIFSYFLLVLRAGCGIWLYQFLIIAYHFTLSIICKCGILGIGCMSIWCASGRGFLFQASANWMHYLSYDGCYSTKPLHKILICTCACNSSSETGTTL